MADTYMILFPENPMVPDSILKDNAQRDGLQFISAKKE